jgi:phage terminase small subunit
MALTNKQAKFLEEYLKDLNATQAAIRAGYSERSARAIGSNLLTKVDIQEAIRQAIPDEAEVKLRIARIARGEKPGVEMQHELKALELLGKAHGLFVDRQKVEAEISGGLVFLPGKDNAGNTPDSE